MKKLYSDLIVLLLALGGTILTASPLPAEITIFPDSLPGPVNAALLGTNFTSTRNYSALTTEDPGFMESAEKVSPAIVRWPGGNNADHYDWKHNLLIHPGRRESTDDLINFDDVVRLIRQTGAELSITVNFGTMTSDDAADMVEFVNGDASILWGARRDSILTANGLEPGPLNVRYFEIGNEIIQLHMWPHSWTAENPKKYFLGGSEERRGVQLDPPGTKGDLFTQNADGSPLYYLQFPIIENMTLLAAVIPPGMMNEFLSGNIPPEDVIALLDTVPRYPQPSDIPTGEPGWAMVDSLTGTIHIGNGWDIPEDMHFLAEYTSTGHDGFLGFARKMKAVDPDIFVGANMLPRYGDGSVPDSMQVPVDSLDAVFEQMDFLIVHQYEKNEIPENATFEGRRRIPNERMQRLQESLDQVTQLNDGLPVPLALTEWNFFNKRDSLVHRNRNLEIAVLASEFLIRTMNSSLPLLFAEQFTLSIWGDKFCLIQTDSDHAVNALTPFGWVFNGFSPWRDLTKTALSIDSPGALATDVWLPYLQSAAGMNSTGDTLYLAISQTAPDDTLLCTLNVQSTGFSQVFMKNLTADDPLASNTDQADAVVLSPPVFLAERDSIYLPPCSVTFLKLFDGLEGDLNRDGVQDVLDVVLAVDMILSGISPGTYQAWAADMNGDGHVDVVDVVELVALILGN